MLGLQCPGPGFLLTSTFFLSTCYAPDTAVNLADLGLPFSVVGLAVLSREDGGPGEGMML